MGDRQVHLKPKRFCRVICVSLFMIVVSGCSLLWAASQIIHSDSLLELRFISNCHQPLRVVALLNADNLDFIAGLAEVVAGIHLIDRLTASESFRLHVVSSDPKHFSALQDRLTKRIWRDYIGKNRELTTSDDVWTQDWGEFALARLKTASRPVLLLFDSKYGEDTEDVPGILARNWNMASLKNSPLEGGSGDYGGNMEVTPDNILVIGSTASKQLRSFLRRYGYRDRMVVLDTDWLYVGHIDEYISIVPNSKAPTGYSIIKANPQLGMRLLQQSKIQDFSDIPAEGLKDRLIALHQLLVSPNGPNILLDERFDARRVIERNRQLAGQIDRNVDRLVKTIHRIHKDFIPVSVISFPVLYHPHEEGKEVSLLPNTVNLLPLRHHLVLPEPLIPLFRDYILETARREGYRVHFLDSLYYHQGDGNIHCCTNVFRHPTRLLTQPWKRLPRRPRRQARKKSRRSGSVPGSRLVPGGPG